MRLSALALSMLLLCGFSGAQDTNFPTGPQYLVTNNAMFLHPISTPSMSLGAPLPGVPSLPQIGPSITDQPYVSIAQPQYQPDLFPIYYGYRERPVIELTGEAPREVPASINDTGFLAITSVRSLEERGYGKSVADDAAFWKTHKRPVTRVYTNADIRR